MPIFPPPAHMAWQLHVTPLVHFDLRRPIYLAPRNNGLGPPRRPLPKPAPLVHIQKQTRSQALANASVGTAVGGPTTSSYLKVTDLADGAVQPQPLQSNGPSLGSAPTANVRPFQKPG